MRLLVLALLVATPLAAQTFTREATPFPVTLDGVEVESPFVGGFFEPRPTLLDIDADGDADLIVNVGGAGLQVFRRDGDRWVWQTDRLGGIEPGNWSTFADLDGDGDYDLLTRGDPGRVRYWRNVGTPQAAQFEVGAALLRDAAGEPVNVEDSSIPALGDIDGDGDADLFAGKADIGTITTYQNEGVDANGVPVFSFLTDRYQDIVIYEENPQCAPAAGRATPSREAGGANLPQRGSMHGANAIALADLNGDDAPELFWGDFFAPSLFYFLNRGTPTDPQLTLASERFPVGQPLSSGGYNAPTYGDLEGDGDLDLLVGVQRGLCFQARTAVSNLIAFENEGTAEAPDLRLRTDRLIDGLDLGQRTTVALADLDGDGDLDLLVGGFNGRFAFLRNTGSARAPAFDREDDRFEGVDTGQYARGTLGDLDGDGDLDLIGGASSGRVRVYRNVGTSAVPSFATESNGAPTADDEAFRIAVGIPERLDGDAAPALSDLDGDGDLDLLLGTAQGEILVYQNVGTPTAPMFEAAESVVAGRRRTTPTLGDLDGDGRPEILAGTSAGGVLFWRGSGGTWAEPAPSPDLGLRVTPNPSTGAVSFRAPSAQGEVVVYDVRGRRVADVLLSSGQAAWDGTEADGQPAASGVYLAQLQTRQGVQTVPFTRVR